MHELPERFGEMTDRKAGKQAKKLLPNELAQPIAYRNKDGSRLEGAFILRPMSSLKDKAAMARTRASLAMGLPWDSFTPEEQLLLDSMATCEVLFSDPEKGRAPGWWYDSGIAKLEADLVIGLALKAKEYDANYFRGVGGPGDGTPEKPRLEFLPTDGGSDGATG